jgi:hypothetical protein
MPKRRIKTRKNRKNKKTGGNNSLQPVQQPPVQQPPVQQPPVQQPPVQQPPVQQPPVQQPPVQQPPEVVNNNNSNNEGFFEGVGNAVAGVLNKGKEMVTGRVNESINNNNNNQQTNTFPQKLDRALNNITLDNDLDSSIKSDLRNFIKAVKTIYTIQQKYSEIKINPWEIINNKL